MAGRRPRGAKPTFDHDGGMDFARHLGQSGAVLAIAAAVAPVFLILVLGNLLRRLGFPDGQRTPEATGFWAAADRLVYWVLFPALLFQETSRAPLGDGVLGQYALILLCAMLFAGFAALGVARATGSSNASVGSIFQGAMRHNTFIAFAACDSLFGAAGMAQASLATAVLVPATNVAAVSVLVMLGHDHAAGNLGRRLGQELVRNPLLIAIALGLTCNLAGLDVPQVLRDSVGLLARVALPLALLCVGAALRIRALRQAGFPTLISLLGKLALFPAIVFGLVSLTGLAGMPAIVAAIYGAVPTAVSGYALARQLGSDAELMAVIITAQTLAAILTMPVTLQLAMMLFG